MIIGHSMTDKEIIRKIISKVGAKVYFIGIGGVSMSALALMAKNKGIKVFGSDINKSSYTDLLLRNGVIVTDSHKRSKIISTLPDLVVYSLSISRENVEYVAAKNLGIPTVSRAEFLGALIEEYGISVGVSGSHGKSTVTAMVAKILESAEKYPTVLCGADISENGGYINGNNEYLVYEACEYGDSFLKFSPDITIMLNLDLDHTDYFENEEKIKESFVKAGNLSKICIMCADNARLLSVKDKISSKVYTFSKSEGSDYRYEIKGSRGGCFSFDLYKRDLYIDSFTLGVMGEFNVSNAVGATVAALLLGIPKDTVKSALYSFHGLPRRLELLKKTSLGDVFYDYAHHPCEVKAAREALCGAGYKSICAVFAPHTYSRTKAFLGEFSYEFSKFSKVYVTDIYGAREAPIAGINAMTLSEKIKEEGGVSCAVRDINAVDFLRKEKYDAIILMGAGRLDVVKKEISKLD